MPLHVTYENRVAVIQIEGAFDADRAAKVRALVMSSAPDVTSNVVIDLSKAREVSDVALAAVLDLVGARQRGGLVSFRGLTDRHTRMLRLLASRPRNDEHAPR